MRIDDPTQDMVLGAGDPSPHATREFGIEQRDLDAGKERTP
jgi:hypothetical protein